MRLRRGTRPWPIALFCALTLGSGLYDYFDMLANLTEWQAELSDIGPAIEWTRDMAIVVASALFSIVLIPVIAIWGFASRLARWFVTIMAALIALPMLAIPFIEMEMDGADWISLGLAAVSAASTMLLWAPAAQPWFSKEAAVDAVVFE